MIFHFTTLIFQAADILDAIFNAIVNAAEDDTLLENAAGEPYNVDPDSIVLGNSKFINYLVVIY